MEIPNIPLKLIFNFWKGSKKRFFKHNFRRFLSFWAGSSLTKKRQKEWSNRFFSFPKQFSVFEKIQKRPLLHPKLEKSKKYLFKGRRSGQIDFFLFFDPPNVPVLIPKQFSNFEKKSKMSKKTPLTLKANPKLMHSQINL